MKEKTMTGHNEQELEVKFLLSNPDKFIANLKKRKAEVHIPRVHEVNLRLDTPARDLSRQAQVLRLRKDTRIRITFKGPAEERQDVSARREIEFEVSDFDSAKALFEALGYFQYILYEKYRTTYQLAGVEITLDEMPYGYFAEIEGPDPVKIRATAERLGLIWETRSIESYLSLFQRVKDKLILTFNDLSFENFEGISVAPTELGINPGDL
jgi:adenylate cyclase class 2